MARVAGVDLPKNKRLLVALTKIYGIGHKISKDICKKAGFKDSLRVYELRDDDIVSLRGIIEKNYKVEGDKRREKAMNIKRLTDLGTYRGLRHRKGLPVRGQSTRQNARTRKGPRKTIANKKKAI
ncbi:MAG: 30S ribosomal protein S13 [Bdellovibrionales bacterium]|nr:30S ribosomal protein S13 [Bdellovibrionales bacterium]